MAESEKQIEKYLKARVHTLGGKSYKWVSPMNNGVPDRINFFPGGLIIITELKAPGKQPRPLQKKVIRDLRDLGTEVLVIDSLEGVRVFADIVKEMIENYDLDK